MVKIVMSIEGMACSMCEAHVNDAVRRSCKTLKVTSSHKKGSTEVIAEEAPDEAVLRAAIEDFGYVVKSYSVEPHEKKGFSIFRK